MVRFTKTEKVHVDRSYGKPILVRSNNVSSKQKMKDKKKKQRRDLDKKIKEYKIKEAKEKAKVRAKKIKQRQKVVRTVRSAAYDTRDLATMSMLTGKKSTSKKKKSKSKKGTRYVVRHGKAYPIAKPKTPIPEKRDHLHFSWNELKMPKMEDLFK